MIISNKKMIIVLLLVLCLTLCACGKTEQPRPTPDVTPVPTSSPAPEIPGMREYNKGLSYYNGDGVERNFEKALEAFLEAANKEFLPAMEKLGYMHEMGLGTSPNPETAGLWFSVAAQRGSEIARMYIDGVGHLNEKAVHSLLPADAVGEYELGMACFYGIREKQDYSAAFGHFSNSAQLGCGRGCYGLAVCYLLGKGTEQNFEKAAEYFEKALELGCLDAADRLIYLYAGEYGAEANAELEEKWRQRRFEILTIAAGHGYSSYTLEAAETALDDSNSELAQEWYKKYFEEYEKLSEEGDAESQFAMAVYYMTRESMSIAAEAEEIPTDADEIPFSADPENNPDLIAARELLESSAAQDNIYAQQLLWCDKLDDEEYLEARYDELISGESYYVYPLNINYWLCYRDSQGEVKVKMVYIPACGSGETTLVTERFSDEPLYELKLYRRQLVSDLKDCITRTFASMDEAELIGFYPLAAGGEMYQAVGISELYSIAMQYGEYFDFMTGEHPKPGSLISLGELCRIYLEMLPKKFRA